MGPSMPINNLFKRVILNKADKARSVTLRSPGVAVLMQSHGSAVPTVVQVSLRMVAMENVPVEESKPPEPPSDEKSPWTTLWSVGRR